MKKSDEIFWALDKRLDRLARQLSRLGDTDMKKMCWILALCVLPAMSLLGVTLGKTVLDRVIFYDSGTTGETIFAVSPLWWNEDYKYNTSWTAANLTDQVFDSNSGTLTVAANIGGTAIITTHTDDNDVCELSTPLIWQASKSCGMEARIAIDDVDQSALVVGFSDDDDEASGIAVSLNGTSLTTNATDFAGFFYDADAATDDIHALSVKADTDGTPHTTSTTMVDGEYHVYRIEIDAVGNVNYWLDGNHIATDALGITTTTDLAVYIGVATREADANTFKVDYIRAWENR